MPRSNFQSAAPAVRMGHMDGFAQARAVIRDASTMPERPGPLAISNRHLTREPLALKNESLNDLIGRLT